ncbi:amino acid kinase family protein [Salarchaeum japonicum]|uniref:Carbamate kinase n=1 Tax=Salarchaeum japonicum TaxID=555573 RepID=A0AAV3T243_9EURY|nr:carbamate kinase [Salarchaeum japonicum]
MRTVVALGGNALVSGGEGGVAEMRDHLARVAPQLGTLAERGHDLVVTHGNGPQVGGLLREQAAADTAERPLDVLVAETQAQIGTLVVRALDAELDAQAVSVVTHAVVDSDDDAFSDPAKPVGPYLDADTARNADYSTREVETERGTVHRRVVPSPKPRGLLESEHVARLADAGTPVVCGGGGGVPVARDDGNESLRGVEAVVDKDYTAELLARETDADTLLLVTDVPCAYRNYNTPDQEPIRDASVGRMRDLLDAGEFEAGSMRPKVDACLDFLDADGERAIITTIDDAAAAVEGDAGTRIS